MNNSRRTKKHTTVKTLTLIIGICFVGYIVGPPLYWQLSDLIVANLGASSSSSSSHYYSYCPPCICDCSSLPLLSISDGLGNNSFVDCMKHNPEMSEEAERRYTNLLAEELRHKEEESLQNQRRLDMVLLEAKKIASQYLKEADKCNSGMETCEDAREKAEAALEAQRMLSYTWEVRARQRGWKEGVQL